MTLSGKSVFVDMVLDKLVWLRFGLLFQGERKQVTVLFADLKGSMGGRRDDGAVRRLELVTRPGLLELLRLLPFVFGGRAGRMESSLWMGLLPSAGASVEIDTPRMVMLHLASRAIRDRGLWRTDLAA
jgi:hypothetical protein